MTWFNTRSFLIGMVILIASTFPSRANELDCPNKIAAFSNDNITTNAIKILKPYYAELGCNIEFTEIPGRRGIRNFNHKLVDGEVYRLRKIEPYYERPFVRSKIPLIVASNHVWLHPIKKNSGRHQLGYLLGVIWHEDYIKNHKGKAFHSVEELIDAYNRGNLSGFLQTDLSVEQFIKDKKFLLSPEKGELLSVGPLYHYLGKEFTSIMDRISERLAKKQGQ
ncbi:MAG: hypothetical protein OQJ97_13830 [Rhodospirillales bacterium]|nr:hypothetical protein [Rhodospirillales bacterium]